MADRMPRTYLAGCLLMVVCLAAGPALGAQEGSEGGKAESPAATAELPFDELGLFAGQEVNVEVNLSGAMIRLAAAALHGEEPELGELVRGIRSIRAQVVSDGMKDPALVRSRIKNAVGWLEDRGWGRMVKTLEDDEEVHIFVLESGSLLTGITVLAFEGDGAVAVNIVGEIDPKLFGEFMARQDLSDVRDLLGDD